VSKKTEAQIDKIVAMCDGDLRGALKALMLVNEHLETELEKFQAAASGDVAIDRVGSLH
jgi:hypothetical protein